MALRLSLFQCVHLKSASKCGRQRLPGASALLLLSCAHCVRFAGCFCFFVFLFCAEPLSSFVLLTVMRLCLPEYQSSASFDILLIFFLPPLHAITVNKHRTTNKTRHQTKDIPLKRSHQTNKLIRWNKGEENVLQTASRFLHCNYYLATLILQIRRSTILVWCKKIVGKHLLILF